MVWLGQLCAPSLQVAGREGGIYCKMGLILMGTISLWDSDLEAKDVRQPVDTLSAVNSNQRTGLGVCRRAVHIVCTADRCVQSTLA